MSTTDTDSALDKALDSSPHGHSTTVARLSDALGKSETQIINALHSTSGCEVADMGETAYVEMSDEDGVLRDFLLDLTHQIDG